MSKYLYVRLSGPMQSWGSGSLFWHRGTEVFPTKSGVLGLLFCAMGRGGPQKKALAEISRLPQKAFQIGCTKEKQRLTPILVDFHMVGGGYDENDPWQLECIPKTSDGKKAGNGGAKLTRREYLQNVNFAVIQEIPEAWCEGVVKAFREPTWDIYLGRKCCSPALPVFGGIFDTEADALEKIEAEIPTLYGDGYAISSVWEESSLDDVSAQLIRDIPLSFGKTKIYAERAVIRKDLTTSSKG